MSIIIFVLFRQLKSNKMFNLDNWFHSILENYPQTNCNFISFCNAINVLIKLWYEYISIYWTWIIFHQRMRCNFPPRINAKIQNREFSSTQILLRFKEYPIQTWILGNAHVGYHFTCATPPLSHLVTSLVLASSSYECKFMDSVNHNKLFAAYYTLVRNEI